MATLPAPCETYLDFVRNTAKLKEASKLPPLDEVEQSLLNTIASQVAEGKPSLLVGDIIYSKQIGSPATLQRRLSKLAEADFIRYGSDPDGRKKYLELTPKAIDYIAKLGQCITAAASKNAVLSVV
jgi:hypothetical protein